MPAGAIIVSAKIEGVKDILAALEKLGGTISKRVIVSTLKKASKPIVEDARARAPKSDVDSKEGWKSIKARRNKFLKEGGISIGPDGEHFYLMFNEWGTINQPALPFLRPAWDIHKREVLDGLGPAFWKVIHRTVKTLGRKAERGTLGKKAFEQLGGRF